MKRFYKMVLPAACFMVLFMPGLFAQPVMNLNLDCPNISGQLTYFNNAATLLYDVQVQLKTTAGQLLQTTTTDYLGHYEFCQLTPGNYLITAASTRPAGGVNATDALIALRHYVGQITLTGLKFKAADINDNGYVNSTDALMILRRFVGQITTFPAGEWVFESNTITVTGDSPVVLNIKGLSYGDLDGSFTPAGCTPMPTTSDAGPDQNVTGSTTSLAGNTPIDGTGEWSIATGTGGNITDPADPASGFSGTAGNTYTLVWTITTVCASTTDTVTITFTPPSFTCGSPITDTRDGQVYNTVLIGTQCWMQQNLNIGTMIPNTQNPVDNLVIEKYCYSDDPMMCTIYGGHYNWNEMMQYATLPGGQGICPTGWHIPSDQDWCTLTSFLDVSVNCNLLELSGINAGGKMKETGTIHWLTPNTGATNESGFTVLPAGYHYSAGSSDGIGHNTWFWSSSESQSAKAYYRYLYSNTAKVGRGQVAKENGFSVRCMRD